MPPQATRAVDARRDRPGALVPEGRLLEEDLQGDIDGAPALEQAHRVVQVDLVGGRQHRCRLEVVARADE